jgi:diguanylate cyclase
MFKSFRARLTLAIGMLVLGVTATLSAVLGHALSQGLEREQGRALSDLAHSVASVLGGGLDARLHDTMSLAENDLFPYARTLADVNSLSLDRIAAVRNNYSWIGVADTQGKVLASTRGLLQGADVSQRRWFIEGLKAAFVGDVHAAKLLAAKLPASADGSPPRFIDFAAPLTDARGQLVGVLGAHVNWDWAREVIGSLRSTDSWRAGVRVFVVDRGGQVVHRPLDADAKTKAPAALDAHRHPSVLAWPDERRYLTAAEPLAVQRPESRLGWTIVVRQPAELAFAPIRQAQQLVWSAGALVMLIVMFAAWFVAGVLSRPMYALDRVARRIEAGEFDTPMPAPVGSAELRSLNASIAGMTRSLLGRERALRDANEQLEARVEARTHELAAANAALNELARQDALTGLPNRPAADDRLAHEMTRHRRNLAGLTVLMVDIDRFKAINDTHGHAVGDEVLKVVARTLSGQCRASDFVARLGGEEFLVLLPETGAGAGRLVADKLRRAVAEAALPYAGRVTVSMGMAAPAEYYADGAAALAAADVALYAAKRGGRNRVVASGEEEVKAPAAAPA